MIVRDELSYYRWHIVGIILIVLAVLIFDDDYPGWSVALGFLGFIILFWKLSQ